jgi:hypothetical protein
VALSHSIVSFPHRISFFPVAGEGAAPTIFSLHPGEVVPGTEVMVRGEGEVCAG